MRIILCPRNSKFGMLGISRIGAWVAYDKCSIYRIWSYRRLIHTRGFDAIKTSNLHVVPMPDLQRTAIGVYPEGENIGASLAK